MRHILLSAGFSLAFISALFAAPAVAADSVSMPVHDHIMVLPNGIQWTVGPESLPKGAQMAVLEGDPKMAGPFTMRLKFPAGYVVSPHWHPADEHVTVISGSLSMGLGETFSKSATTEMPPGSFGVMAKGTRHFAFSRDGAELQIHGIGPWGVTYVNPKDDPRLKK